MNEKDIREYYKKNPSAFPINIVGGSTINVDGMSLRDYFAGQALMGDLSGENEFTGITTGDKNGGRAANLAFRAYRVADAMMKERVK